MKKTSKDENRKREKLKEEDNRNEFLTEILKLKKKLVVRGQSERVKLEELRKKNNEE